MILDVFWIGKRLMHFQTLSTKLRKIAEVMKARIFVVQHHIASSAHYDFRLEINGVLKSWAVPKGPSMDPDVKRLAIHVDDHAMSYAGFEGVIPKGQYGAGPVMLWDRGTYENTMKFSMEEGMEKGELRFRLDGEKLKGGFSLVRMRGGKGNNWLLIKSRDSEAKKDYNPVETKTKSVLTGRTMDEIRDE